MRLLSFLLLYIKLVSLQAAYVPGTPGAQWTEEELIAAKGKIRLMIDHPKEAIAMIPGGREAQAMYQNSAKNGQKDAILPDLSKVVRLTFHDCVPEEGGAGCNGCFNFKNVGNLYAFRRCSKRGDCDEINEEASATATDNNNLYWVAELLEHIYKNATFGPENYPQHFKVSLFDSGKSRSDLWALAGLVALQASSEKYQRFCSRKANDCGRIIGDTLLPCGYDYPYTEFKTGRVDCVSSCTDKAAFCSDAAELHPNPHGNGEDTTQYFRENFDLTAEETVALMGVHTLGHPHESISQFRHYPWTTGFTNNFLDNFYYINLVNRTGYRQHGGGQPNGQGGCTKSRYFGNEYGHPFNLEFRVRSEMRNNAHGPFNWGLFGGNCNSEVCKSILSNEGAFDVNSCCHGLGKPFKGCPKFDPNCEQDFTTFFAVNMLSVDVGLHRRFTVGADGRPLGCPGMDNDQQWLDNKRGSGFSFPSQCPLNTELTEENEPMHAVVERYADDVQLWVDDFTAVFSKMLEKGYAEGELTPAPRAWFDARKRRGIWRV